MLAASQLNLIDISLLSIQLGPIKKYNTGPISQYQYWRHYI